MSKLITIKNSIVNYKSDAFSSTDLSKSNKDYGIVFPFKEVSKYTPSVSSIIKIIDNKATLAHTEHRLVENQEKDSITYFKGYSVSLVKNKREEFKPNIIQKMFKIQPFTKETSYGVTNVDIFPKELENSDEFFQELFSILEDIDIVADTEFVDETNLDKKSYSVYNQHKYGINYIDDWEDYSYKDSSTNNVLNKKEKVEEDPILFLNEKELKRCSRRELIDEFLEFEEDHPQEFEGFLKTIDEGLVNVYNYDIYLEEMDVKSLREVYRRFQKYVETTPVTL